VPWNARSLDEVQRRRPALGFPIAVVYKFFDDLGPYLAAILTYYAFVAIFPMLLIASTVLGVLVQGDEELQTRLLDSALSQFPIVGEQLGRPGGLEGSTTGVVVGALAALYGLLGLGQAAQHALNTVWAVPRNSRFNPFVGRLRGLVSMLVAGVAVLAVTALTTLSGNLDAFGLVGDTWLRRLGTLATVLLTTVVLAVMMRFTTARRPSFRTNLPGALTIAVLWHLLQVAGGVYVRRVVASADEMSGVFAIVLGLIALIFLASTFAVLGLEVSAVLSRRLFPRALLTPFTDAVELTEADRRAYASYARMQRHKGFQHVDVTFDEDHET
jgi:YihY family inner membrane protein